jgi:hypothetical protein
MSNVQEDFCRQSSYVGIGNGLSLSILQPLLPGKRQPEDPQVTLRGAAENPQRFFPN